MAAITVDRTKLDANISELQKRFTGVGRNGYIMLLAGPMHQFLQRQAKGMFAQERDATGNKWAPLAESTAHFRRSLGYNDRGGYHPINRRTGDLEELMTGSPPDIRPAASSLVLMFPGSAQQRGDRPKKMAQAAGRVHGPARPVVDISPEDVGHLLVLANRFFAQGLGGTR